MPFVRQGPKGMRASVPGKLTPRQKVALRRPCINAKGGNHFRYHRRNGGFQTVLTLDLFDEDFKEKDPTALTRAVWHARVTTAPEPKRLAEWTIYERTECKTMLMRLLKNVGHPRVDVKKDAEDPPTTVHMYKYATAGEIARALKAIEKAGTSTKD